MYCPFAIEDIKCDNKCAVYDDYNDCCGIISLVKEMRNLIHYSKPK
jgi:hypothetical protein